MKCYQIHFDDGSSILRDAPNELDATLQGLALARRRRHEHDERLSIARVEYPGTLYEVPAGWPLGM